MRNSIIYLIPFLLIGFVSKFNFSQVLMDYDDITIFFGDKQKSRTNIEAFIKTKTDGLLCVQNKLSFFDIFSKRKSKYTFDFITNYNLPPSNPIDFYGNGKNADLFLYTPMNENILGISSQTTFFDKEPNLFYHIIHPKNQETSNHGFSLNSDFLFNKEINLSHFYLKSSQDNKYASLLYVPETQPQEYANIKYLNFKDTYSSPQKGTFIYPFPVKDYELLDFYVQNDTSQYIIAGHFAKSQKSKHWKVQDHFFESIVIGKLDNQTFTHKTLEAQGKFFSEIEFYFNQKEILIYGLYSSFLDGKIEGVFTAKLDSDIKIINPQFSPFSMEVIQSIADYNNSFLNNPNSISNEYEGFNLIDFQPLEDGFIGVAEFNALEYRYGGNDVPGAANTIDSYFWSTDVLVFKINTEGMLEWSKIIPKYQRSINDGGYYLSTATYFGKNKLHLFFNDNLLNYNEEGHYSKSRDVPVAAHFNSSKNTIAHISVELSNGNIQRKSTLGKEEIDLLFVPQLSSAFPTTNKLMIYARSGTRHKIGSVSFKD